MPRGRDFGPPIEVTITADDGTGSETTINLRIKVIADPAIMTGTSPEHLEWDQLEVGQPVYADDGLQFTRVPGDLRTLRYLRTENSMQYESGDSFIAFDVDRPINVLIAYDNRITDVPQWLANWADTGLVIETGDTEKRVYSKSFNAGRVMLGGNELGFSMYTVIVDDGTGYGNSAPIVSDVLVRQAAVGTEYSVKLQAIDIDGDSVAFGASDLPPWAILDSGTGEVFGTPSNDEVGLYEGITIFASDGTRATELQPFQIEVLSSGGEPESIAQKPPVISGTPSPFAVTGQRYEFTAQAFDPNGDGYRFKIKNLPSWAWFNDLTGFLGGHPENGDVGTYDDIVISVADRTHTVSLPPFSITVGTQTTPGAPPAADDGPANDDPPSTPPDPTGNDTPPSSPPGNSPPTISGSPVPFIKPRQRYRFAVESGDVDDDELHFRIRNLPSWAWFNVETGVLGGRPENDDVGTYDDIVISVADRTHTVSLPPFSITVGTQTTPGAPPAADDGPANDDPPSTPPDPTGNDTPPPPSMPPTGDDSDSDPTPPRDDSDMPTDDDTSGDGSNSPPPSNDQGDAPPANSPPTISGSPETSVLQNQLYSFIPTANDPDSGNLTFSISGRPSWASFDNLTGRLRGTPDAADVGTYRNIVIRVSDGEDTTALPSFGIEVLPTATGSATLSWNAPTRRSDGSALTNLAGFVIYWGRSRGNYPNSERIDNAGVTTYVVEDLTEGTWHFAVTAIDSNNSESKFSNSAIKTIQP